MRVDDTRPFGMPPAGGQRAASGRLEGAKVRELGDAVQLSLLSRAVATPTDAAARLEAIREALRTGQYPIDPARISQRMIDAALSLP
jgi:anti-sigma28 factor (negative regulator of flagellin synthesis)